VIYFGQAQRPRNSISSIASMVKYSQQLFVPRNKFPSNVTSYNYRQSKWLATHLRRHNAQYMDLGDYSLVKWFAVCTVRVSLVFMVPESRARFCPC